MKEKTTLAEISRLLLLMLVTANVALLWGCRQRSFWYPGQERTVKVQIEAKYDLLWMIRSSDCPWTTEQLQIFEQHHPELLPKIPSGLRCVVYREAEQPLQYNLPATGGEIALPFGKYDFLFYNNDTQNIAFEEMGSIEDAYGCTLPITEATDSTEAVVSQPNVLFSASSILYDGGIITRCSEPVVESEGDTLSIVLQPGVFSYLIRLNILDGVEYVKKATAIFSGLSEGVRLWNRQSMSLNSGVSMRLEMEKEDNSLVGCIRTFGISELCDSQRVELAVSLSNGRRAVYYYNVTPQARRQPKGGIIQVDDIIIRLTDGENNSSMGEGWEVDVNSWGNNTDLPVTWE